MTSKQNKISLALSFLTIAVVFTISLQFYYFRNIDSKLIVLNQVSRAHVVGAKSSNMNQSNPSQELKDFSFLNLEYAFTPEEQEKGLMYRQSMCENCGMLFIFNYPSNLSFWMKNTYLPLDIIFIASDGTVLNIEKAREEQVDKSNAEYPSYISKGQALYVLEVNQGWAEKNQLKAGYKIDMLKIMPKAK